jgi:hypothetical protein
MDCVDVGAAIQKKFDDGSRPSLDSAMKGRASSAVAAIEQRGIRIEQFADSTHIPSFSGEVNLMLLVCFRCRRSTTTIASLLENPGDVVVATLLRHVNQALTVVTVPFRIRSGIEKQLHDF